ncbi:MAG: SAM-dependent methyltransferase [Nitrospirota bacterium]
MNSLKQKIIDKISSEGPISFETFMEMALYDPGLGYYAKESTVIGKAGDFYTSPHLHAIFGAMLGRQMEEMWLLMERPDCFQIVEMGAGMGYLAKDMLDYLKGKDIFDHLTYTIIELNPNIKARQQTLLADLRAKVTWTSGLNELGPVQGCFLSNELLDAFPVRLVEMDDEVNEVYVAHSGASGLAEVKRPCSSEIKDYFNAFSIRLEKGYKTEVNLRIKDWLREISSRLSEGFILTIDYGYSAQEYYSEERKRGTLLCYYRHQISDDPYQHIGEQDITAHVNFSSLKKWGEELGIAAIGFCPQGTYLVSLGIDEVIRERYGDAPDPFEMAKIKGLLFPQGMGESHSIMIQYKGGRQPVLRGFSVRNRVKRL